MRRGGGYSQQQVWLWDVQSTQTATGLKSFRLRGRKSEGATAMPSAFSLPWTIRGKFCALAIELARGVSLALAERCAMGKLCCCGEANAREEVYSEAAESPHPAAAADTREQRSSSAPPARSQVIIAQERLHKSSSFTDRRAASPGGGGVRRSASSLRYTPQHGIQRDSTTRSDRTKLKVPRAADT